jgi:hypothetical protein
MDSAPQPVKQKKQLSEAQLAALQRGRQRLAEKRMAKQGDQSNTLVVDDSTVTTTKPAENVQEQYDASYNDSEDSYEGGFCSIM